MTVTTDPNVWVIYALVFFLGLLVGVFLTAGGRRKWKTRYNSEGRTARKSGESANAVNAIVKRMGARNKAWRAMAPRTAARS